MKLILVAGELNNYLSWGGKVANSTFPGSVGLYVDSETGVEYFINTSEGGICLRVDANGKPMVNKKYLKYLERKRK